jgi:DNA-binding SARP family transcriptional activator
VASQASQESATGTWPYSRMSQAPLVGREAELASLTAELTTALGGPGGVLVIRGEAGIGKTRLAEAALEQMSEALTLRGKATERETPLVHEGVLAALRQLRRVRGLLSLEHCSPRLEPYRPALAAFLPEWRVGLRPEQVGGGDRHFLYEGIAELFAELVDVQPVALFLDDAQWMDGGSHELISYLARSLHDRPFALLLGIRDGETRPDLETLLAELRGAAPFAAWTLRRLDASATTALAATWLEVGPEQIDGRLAARLHAETQGNPFFLREVVSSLVEANGLRRVGERVELTAGRNETTGGPADQPHAPMLPSGILVWVQRRLSHVPQPARTVLEAASILGELVEVELLRRALDLSSETLLVALDELERRLFLMPDDRSPERSVRFVHPQIREGVYRGLPLEQRLRWHREAARVLEALPEQHPARTLPAIAYHLSLAEEAERAVPYLLKAGEQTMQLPAYAQAGWYFTRAARHLEQLKLQGSAAPLTRWEGQLLLMRGHLYWAGGRYAESSRSFLTAWELLRDVDDPAVAQHRPQAALFHGFTLLGAGDITGGRTQLESCRPLIESAPAEWALGLYFQRAWANLCEAEGDWEGAYQALRTGLEQATALGSEMMTQFALALHEEALARGNLAETHALADLLRERAEKLRTPNALYRHAQVEHAEARSRGDWITARQKADEMVRVMAQIDNRPYLFEARLTLLRLQARSDPTAAWLRLRQEAETAAAAGDVRRQAQVGLLQAVCALELDHPQEAAATAEATLALASQISLRPVRASVVETSLCCLAEAALRQCRPEEARPWLDAGSPAGARPDDLWTPLRRVSLSAWMEALAGEAEAARQALAEVAAGLPRVGEAWLRGVILGDAALAAHALGEAGETRRLLAEAEECLSPCGATGRVAFLRSRIGLEPTAAATAVATSAPQTDEARPATAPGPAAEGDAGTAAPAPAALAATAPGLRIRLLGSFEVWRGSERITYEVWGSRKARNLFKYLCLQRGRPVSMDELLEMFWPELTLESASHALRTTLHRIRRVLEPDRAPRTPSAYLRVAEDAVHFPAEGRIWLDVAEFEARLREAERREVGGDVEGGLQGLRDALEMYPGDLLPEDRYEEWSLVPREQLQERCREALTRLWRAASAAGSHPEALRLGERMLELDPCSEDGIQWVLRALDGQNRRTEAVRRYEQFARRLDRELGMEPEPETRRLVEQLKGKR